MPANEKWSADVVGQPAESDLPASALAALRATGGDLRQLRIVMAWQASERGRAPVTGYRIEVSEDGHTGWRALATVDASTTIWTYGGPGEGQTRYYRVRATSAAGDGAPSNVSEADMRVTEVRVTPGVGRLTVRWPYYRNGGGYTVEWWTESRPYRHGDIGWLL